MLLKLALALGLVNAGLSVKDIHGNPQKPFTIEKPAKVNALIFITHDCPISNAYAKEIARICSDYQAKGAACRLIYADSTITDAQAQEHAQQYGHGTYPKFVDRNHVLAKAAGATITPEAILLDGSGQVRYKGRIDDSFAALGQPRRPVKNPDLRNALDDLLAGKSVRVPETKALGCYIDLR